jgi:hypothetical protein
MPLAIGCGALLVVLAACGGEVPDTSSAGDHPTTVTSTATAPPPAVTPTTTVRPRPAASSVCSVGDLDVSLGATEGAAGTVYRALVFTNTGGRTCTIQGFPGVSYVAGDDGHQVGAAATRVGDKGPAMTLRPGVTAAAPVGFVNVGNFDPETCLPTVVRGLRVYPPHDTKSEFVPFETTGCAGDLVGSQLTVRTVHEGSGLL